MTSTTETQEALMMPQENKKRKRQPKKGNGFKVPRKENFMKKIMRNDKATKELSFLKRKPTLITKARQLQQFCGVSVGLVIQGPDGSVDTWPKNREELEGMIWSYRGLDKRRKKEFKLLEFLADKKRKLEKKKDKAVKERVDQLVADALAWLDVLSDNSLVDSVNFLDQKVVDLKEKINLLEDVERKVKENQAVPDVGCDRNNCYDNFDSQIIANGASSSGPSKILDDNTCYSDMNINNFLSQENFGVYNNFRLDDKVENADLVTECNWTFANNGYAQTSVPAGNTSGLHQAHQDIINGGSSFGSCGDFKWPQDLNSFVDNWGTNNFLPCRATNFTANGIDQPNQNNFGLTVEQETLNDNMILPNPSNVHDSPLHELIPNSVWSPWF